MSTRPKRDYHFFEQWARRNRMKPVVRVEEKHGDILIADSGEPFLEDGELKYRTGFAIEREKAWLAAYQDYQWNEFPDRTLAGKQEARVNEALAYARMYLAQTKAAGLYDGGKNSFSQPIH